MIVGADKRKWIVVFIIYYFGLLFGGTLQIECAYLYDLIRWPLMMLIEHSFLNTLSLMFFQFSIYFSPSSLLIFPCKEYTLDFCYLCSEPLFTLPTLIIHLISLKLTVLISSLEPSLPQFPPSSLSLSHPTSTSRIDAHPTQVSSN
jgi:hypothetical protein